MNTGNYMAVDEMNQMQQEREQQERELKKAKMDKPPWLDSMMETFMNKVSLEVHSQLESVMTPLQQSHEQIKTELENVKKEVHNNNQTQGQKFLSLEAKVNNLVKQQEDTTTKINQMQSSTSSASSSNQDASRRPSASPFANHSSNTSPNESRTRATSDQFRNSAYASPNPLGFVLGGFGSRSSRNQTLQGCKAWKAYLPENLSVAIKSIDANGLKCPVAFGTVTDREMIYSIKEHMRARPFKWNDVELWISTQKTPKQRIRSSILSKAKRCIDIIWGKLSSERKREVAASAVTDGPALTEEEVQSGVEVCYYKGEIFIMGLKIAFYHNQEERLKFNYDLIMKMLGMNAEQFNNEVEL
eukprot:TRINITY_DN95592_c0_g1_i1.p1 TRINITY_DN95592_c0_g1~~TRINITY_DN95592_c0_g1_i1.p1  ORF type:complete len:358 (+),score=44.35 TRINITY_DN95592_c0_g1_i1:87-1160(+)